MKKILLIIALLISALGLNAQSVTIGSLKFTVTSETPAECEVSGYSGKPVDVTIPSTVTISGKEFAVTSIGYEAFSDCSSLTSIEIPSGVTSIGNSAFYHCSSLTSIEIPSGVTSIGYWAFSGCESLTSIEFGENSQLTSIGKYAFYECSSLTSIEIPSGVTSIGYEAFYGCKSLTSIEMPSGVTSVGNGAFSYCDNLTSISCHAESVPETGSNAFNYCPSDMVIYVPEQSVDAYKAASPWNKYTIEAMEEDEDIVVNVGDNTTVDYEGYSLKFTVTSVEPAECEVSGYSGEPTDVTIPSTVTISGKEYTVTSIGKWAFEGCYSLTSIEIPSSVTSIGYGAFSGCSSLTSIEIPSSVTSIGNSAFSGCSSLTSIIVESGNTVYDSRDICNAIIETATNTLIAGCQSTVIPNTVTSIGYWAFSGCESLTSIEFGENSQLTSIGKYAFYECSSLTSIEIPSGVTSIGDYAFEGCSSLTSIEIPSGVTSIGFNPFAYCPSLTSIVVESGNTVYDSRDNCNAIIETATNTLIAGCKNIVIPNSVTSIGAAAFLGCSSLTSIEIPSGVTSIGAGAFWFCSSLTSIEIPSGVTSIGSSAFSYCDNLTSIYCYAENVPQTWIDAFDGCPSDMVIYVPEQSVDAYKAASPWNNYTIMPLTDNEGPENPDGNDPNQPTDSVVLVAPALAVDTVTETTVVLVWNAIDSATSYNVYMDSVLVKNVTDTIYTVDSLISDSTYSFMVTAVADTLESEFSNAVTVTTLKAEGEEPEQPENPEEPGDEPEEPIELDAPENVEAKAISTSSIIITWDKVENALSYNIYRDGELLDDTENTNYTDKDLEYNTEYCYTIEAVNGKETSDESEEVCVKTLGEGVEEHETSFNIYPNPVNDKLYIETLTQTLTVEIYDVYGRRQSMVNGQQSTVIDVSDLNSGVYFVKVVTSEGEVVKRFIKE